MAGGDLEAGAEALARCDWPRARETFERASAAGAGPEALEGFAQAAFFLNDPESAIEARERAYAEYRESGRQVDAARVAIALAWDYRAYRGERAISDGWLARARRLLDGQDPTRELGWLAVREASFALPDDVELARERCAEAERIGREVGDLDVEMTAIALDGLVRVSEGDVAGGMARLDEATTAATAGEMRDPLAVGLSCCYLIFACERVRDLERAGQWCQRVAGMAADTNVQALRAICRAHYGTVLMLQGDFDRAEVELTEANAVLANAPREGADVLARLAELRRRQGRSEEAADLAGRVEHHPIAALCQAALSLERDDLAAATDGAERYLRLMGSARTERAPALELLAETHAAAGRAEGARAAAEELAAIAQAARTDPLLGAARYAEGSACMASGDVDAARQAFEDAVGLLGRAQLPLETGRARVALASALRALGRADAAAREFERAADALAELGAKTEERRARLLARQPAAELSERERQVLALIAQGRTNAEIAAALVLSEHTVHRHVANLLAKLRCSKRAEAVAVALEEGLL
jgi:DNA-binding CsgD family transcriptional regulator